MEMFDSRGKLLSLDEARVRIERLKAAPSPVRAVVAICDPLLPEQVERMQQLAGLSRLFVFLGTPADAYLEPKARGELAAALGFVEAVVVCDGDAAESARLAGADDVVDDFERELELRAEFVRFVRERSLLEP